MPAEKRNGFLFSKATEEALTESLEVAFEIFHKEKPLLQSLIRHGMDFDSSWKIPAQQYLRLYKTVDMNKKSPIRK
jgi:starch synthase